MRAVFSVCTLLIGVAIILAGNGLLGSLLGVRGQSEQFSQSVLGLIMSAYFAGFVLGTWWVPRLIRRIGHIRVFATLASVASVTALLHGLYVQAGLWFVLRFCSGACIVGLYIAIESWLNEQTENDQRGHVFSAYMTTTLIGLGIGQLLLMAGEVGRLELFALASVLFSLGLVPVAMTDVSEPRLAAAQRLGLRKLYSISPLGVVSCVFAGIGAGSFWGLGPVFAAAIGFDKAGIAAFMAATILGGIVMLWPVGRASDRLERRRVLGWVCVLAALGALSGAVLVELGSRFVMLGGFAYGAFAFSMYSLAVAHTNDHVDREFALEVTSSLQLLWAAGAIIGPILAGALMQHTGPEFLMIFIAVSALAPAVFASWRMRVSEAVPLEDQGQYLPQFATSPAALELHPDAAGEEGGIEADDDTAEAADHGTAKPR